MSNWQPFSWIEDFSWIFTPENLVGAFLEIKLKERSTFMNGPSAVFPFSHHPNSNFQNAHSFQFGNENSRGFCFDKLYTCLSLQLGNSGFSHDPTSLKDLVRVVDFSMLSFSFCEDGAIEFPKILRQVPWIDQQPWGQRCAEGPERIKGSTSLYFPSCSFFHVISGPRSSV